MKYIGADIKWWEYIICFVVLLIAGPFLAIALLADG